MTRRLCLLACGLALAFAAAPASAKTVWLCKPGLAHNPCQGSLATTVFSPTGKKLRVVHPKADKHPKIDCFYVYPTVSDQTTLQATLKIDPEERSIALYQAARYTQHCRVFAPMYRQLTVPGLSSTAPPAQISAAIKGAYADVLAAWKDYLKHFNKGRGFVLIGHSQGTGHLIQLIRTQIDSKPKLRKRLVSAILMGGNVAVARGKDVGGEFKHVPACRSTRQLGCVVAFSTFDQQVPPDSKFGRGSSLFDAVFGESAGPDPQVLCTNPASLHGGSAVLDALQPSAPFAPGTLISAGIALLQLPLPHASTPWMEFPNSYKGACSSADNANVLQISALGGAPLPHPSPDATWGLHLLDASIGQGNLVKLVGSEAKAYAKKH